MATGGDACHAPARRADATAGLGPGIPSVDLFRRLRARTAGAATASVVGR